MTKRIPIPDPDETVEVHGTLDRVTFHNPENLFTIARLQPAGGRSGITVVGHLSRPTPGETLRVRGRWESHPRYGQQLRVHGHEVLLPESADGIRRYLASGWVQGLGERTAGRIVRHFGAETLSVIETSPERLLEVRGIGETLADRIARAWRDHHAVRRLMAFLEENGVPTVHAAKLLQAYGEDAVAVLSEDPFRAAEDIPGVGFRVADRIARHRGTAAEDPRRVRACIRHLMDRGVADGHTYLPEADLLEGCRGLFEIGPEAAGRALEAMVDEGLLVAEDDREAGGRRIFPAELHDAERRIAERLAVMAAFPPDPFPEDGDRIVETVMRRLAIRLSDAQLAAVRGVLGHRVSIVTGGPGTGKTTVIRSMSAVFRDQGRRVCLAAPTGRAARRLSEVTGEPASTIHKLLGYSPGEGGGFARDRDDPIDADVVVVDEASMVDVPLMVHLVSAVPIPSVLILVGDGYQLPPVGPGAVLSEAMESGCVPVYRLERIYRQETQSAIVVNAHRIREGLRPDFEDDGALGSGGQCILIEAPEPGRAARTVVDLCRRRIPDALGLDPVRDIQVVTPMHRGEAGTLHLNQALQKALNPAPEGSGERPRSGFRVGDKVMHLRNNYEKAVFNGDIGRVLSADPDGGGLRVEYDGREVSYDPAEQDELGLAYAISIHKSQGSEYPAVVIPFLTQHYPMLQRNLLYTALTRARRLAVVVGAVRAVRIALHNDRPRQRLTRLARRIARACRGAGA